MCKKSRLRITRVKFGDLVEYIGPFENLKATSSSTHGKSSLLRRVLYNHLRLSLALELFKIFNQLLTLNGRVTQAYVSALIFVIPSFFHMPISFVIIVCNTIRLFNLISFASSVIS